MYSQNKGNEEIFSKQVANSSTRKVERSQITVAPDLCLSLTGGGDVSLNVFEKRKIS